MYSVTEGVEMYSNEAVRKTGDSIWRRVAVSVIGAHQYCEVRARRVVGGAAGSPHPTFTAKQQQKPQGVCRWDGRRRRGNHERL